MGSNPLENMIGRTANGRMGLSSRGAPSRRAGRMLGLGAVVGVALCLCGCQPGNAPAQASAAASAHAIETTAAPASAQAAAPAASAVATPVVSMRGIYVWGTEVETITPCNGDKTYWLDGREELLGSLQELAIQKAAAANEAYQPIYAELRVSDAGRATDGFAVDYDGVMQLHAVQSASAQVPADCGLPGVPAGTPQEAASR